MKLVRNILALFIGVFVGTALNMAIITLSSSVITPPAGVDLNDLDSLKASMELFETKHFIFPFLAHALGTLVGAITAAYLAASHKMTFAWVIGVYFLIGGIVMIFLLPTPIGFAILDICLAYIPMAWIGGKIGMSIKKK